MAARDLASWIAGILKDLNTHAVLVAACSEFGFAPAENGSKWDRVHDALSALPARDIAVIAERVGDKHKNIELAEAALAVLEEGEPPVTEITRRDVAKCFEHESLSGETDLLELLRKLWPIDQMGDDIFFSGKSLAADIYQHMVRNPEDWSVEYLFEKLGALTCSRKRFFKLLEHALDPLARRGSTQDELRGKLNVVLARDGYRIDPHDFVSGYPTYRVVRISPGVLGKPKNLIFASIGPKPEIGFSDAINNDIVILSNAESCLVYDRPIARSGLLWNELVDWWHSDHSAEGATEEQARKALGLRLRASLASPAEQALFDSFFRRFRASLGEKLPALIPQVYLHYDPAIVARLKHRKGLPRQRMDFLLLLPHDARIVVEVDGAQHFSKDNRPSVALYAEMMSADRDIRLLGYEVYRFGASELLDGAAEELVASFFERLFEKHGVQ